MESAKLVKATGEPLRALQELENSLRLIGIVESRVIDLTEDDENKKMMAKVRANNTFPHFSPPDSHTGTSPPCSMDERVWPL